MDMNQKDNIGVNLEFYYPNSNIKIYTLENYSGNYHTMAETVYDIKFAKTNNEFYATLHNTNVSSKNPKNMSFFKLETPNAGFLSNYVIQTNYEFANSTLIFNYSMFNISKETDLMTYVCHDWDLEIGKCMGVWSIIANAEQDKTNQIITAIVLNFSGFGIKEVANISSIVEARLNAPHSGSNGIIFPDKPTLPKELEIEEAELKKKLEYYRSDEYVEKVAREKLLLQKEGETVILLPQWQNQDQSLNIKDQNYEDNNKTEPSIWQRLVELFRNKL